MSVKFQWLACSLVLIGVAAVGVVALLRPPESIHRPKDPPSKTRNELQLDGGKSNGDNSLDGTSFEPRAVTLARGVHLLGELAPGAAYVIESTEGLILIDSGVHPDAALVASQLTDLGLKTADVKFILLTHAHGDHSLGAKRLREISGATLCAGLGDVEVLEKGGPREAFVSTYHMPRVHAHATEIDQKLVGGETIDLGDVRLRAIATPGHTPGSFCFLMERDGQSILFTGDTVCTLTSVVGTYTAHLSPRYRGNAEHYLASLESLRGLPAPNLVLPGHPRMGRQFQRPRISEDQWRDLLDSGIDEMKLLLKRFEADGRDFLDGQPKSILPDWYYLGEFHHRAIHCFVDDGKLYCFDAPGDKGLHEFIRTQLESFSVDAPLAAVLLTSTDRQAIEGLLALVSAADCRVVAPRSAIEFLVKQCPEGTQFNAAEEVKDRLPSIEALRLAGLGKNPTAYVIKRGDKSIIVSGDALAHDSEKAKRRLARRFMEEGGDAQAYSASLKALQQLDPDLWLPAHPAQGQNANLYRTMWKDALRASLQASSILPSRSH